MKELSNVLSETDVRHLEALAVGSCPVPARLILAEGCSSARANRSRGLKLRRTIYRLFSLTIKSPRGKILAISAVVPTFGWEIRNGD